MKPATTKKTNYVLSFDYPGVIKSMNTTLRMNRYQRNAYFKTVYKSVAALVHDNLPDTPLESARVTLIRCSSRNLDHDGCVGSLKPLVDGLVHAGILKNDTYKITGPWDVWQSYADKGHEHVKVKIEELK